MAGTRTFNSAPTTTSGQPIAGGAGSAPPPASPVAVAVHPETHQPIIRQTEAPREVAGEVDAAARMVPPERQGNEQTLAPLRPPGAPLSGAALVAAVGQKRAAEIEAARAVAGGSASAGTATGTATAVAAAPARPASASIPRQVRGRRPGVASTAVETAPAPAGAATAGVGTGADRPVGSEHPPAPAAGPVPAAGAVPMPSQAAVPSQAASPPAPPAAPAASVPSQASEPADIVVRPVADPTKVPPDYSEAVDRAPAQGITPAQRDGVIELPKGAAGARVIAPDAEAPLATPSAEDALGPILPHQRAGSNTDSPSRGVPRAPTDPGKQITGGFGDALEAQYYPLDGIELRKLIEALLDDVYHRIQDDLRFSMAITYPRVAARVQVIVEGVTEDAGFVIPRVRPARAGQPGTTPLEVAQLYGDQICFVVVSERREFTAEGDSAHPPDAIREELGLQGPRKQRIPTPTGSTVVDVVT